MPLGEPSSSAPLLGRRVAKYFDGIPYPGIVTTYKKPWYLIEFADGDKEEVSV